MCFLPRAWLRTQTVSSSLSLDAASRFVPEEGARKELGTVGGRDRGGMGQERQPLKLSRDQVVGPLDSR